MTSSLSPYISFDRRSGVPFYKQIYDGYRGAILAGRLRPGQRLPSTRALASELKISRLPAVYAFEQLLHEGYIEGRTGSGTYVTQSIPDELTPGPPERPTFSNVAPERRAIDLAPFRVSLPALDRFPQKIWSRLVARNARRLTPDLMAYGDPAGHFPLREAIADYLQTARAVRCDPSQVLIVSGSQMALQICASTLLQRGKSVCVEEPGYPGAHDALTGAGATLVPIEVDEDGVNVDAIARVKSIGAVYVTPSHQYPLGVSMTASRRLALLEWAKRTGAWIIEDDYDSEYRYASRPLGSLQGSDTAARVIYIGTFSKVLFPALRVGYMVVPSALIEPFVRAREALDIFSPILEQLVLTDFLSEGHFGRHLRRMRAIYAGRRDALVNALREHIGLEPYNSDAGLHLSVFLPRGLDDRRVVQKALDRGVHATALSSCYVRRPKNGLILGFGGADERRLVAAARKLGEIVRG